MKKEYNPQSVTAQDKLFCEICELDYLLTEHQIATLKLAAILYAKEVAKDVRHKAAEIAASNSKMHNSIMNIRFEDLNANNSTNQQYI